MVQQSQAAPELQQNLAPVAPLRHDLAAAHAADKDYNPELPILSDAARLQRDVSFSVASAVAAAPIPVSAPVSLRSNSAQLTHWIQLFSELSARSSLSPAEELHLHLVTELLAMYQDSIERSRALDHTYMAQASALLHSMQAGNSASRPIVIPSQSPATMRVTPAEHRMVTPSTQLAPQRVPLPDNGPQRSLSNTDPQQTHTWLAPAQEVSRHSATVKLEREAQERRLYKQQQTLLAEQAQDKAIVKAAEQRIRARELAFSNIEPAREQDLDPASAPATAPAPSRTIRVRKPTDPTHTQEMRVAALTNDSELLRHGSIRIRKSELDIRSDDDDEAVLSELNPALAAEKLFFPKKEVSFRDRNGYVRNAFVAPDDEDTDPAERSVSSGSTPQSDEDSHYTDGDPSSDYAPSKTPSSSPPSRRSISSAQWQEYQALKKAQKDPRQGRQQSVTPRYNISIAEPPEHGDWRDISYLTTTFRDKHVKYVNRCGEGHHLSVWECYTTTARQCIVQHLNDTSTSLATHVTEDYMASLTDVNLYTLLQNELGIQYDVEVENALTAIKFVGSILEVTDWVVFNTAWSQVLKRVTPAGAVLPRRMAELFRNSIPDDFMRQYLIARKQLHPNWTDVYNAAITALKDTNWHKCYNKHISQKPPAAPKSFGASTSSAPTPALASQQKQQKKDVAPTPNQPKSNTPFDPLKFKPKNGGVNVNPNMPSADYWENTSKTPCDRCGDLHRWHSDICTAGKHKKGDDLPPLTPQEFATRLKAKWDRGFYFSKPLRSEHPSPSAKDSAQAASTATAKLSNGKA
jgi:hypothetical protein